MKAKTSGWLVLVTGTMVLSAVPTARGTEAVIWPRKVSVSLTVVDAEGKAVPEFEAMLHTHHEGYTRWQAGKDGNIHFGAGGARSPVLQDDPQLQVIVRAAELAPAILPMEYTMPVKETVTLTPGRLIDLLVRTADGRSIPAEVTPLVVYSDFASRVRTYRMPQNQEPGDPPDFVMSKVRRMAEGHYQFRVPAKTPPFLLAIDAPGFMRSIETDYFDEDDLADARIEWEIPAAARLCIQFDATQAGGLPPFESSWIELACQIPDEGKYITLWMREQLKESTLKVTLDDLPPNRYRAIFRLVPPQSQKTDVRWYSDDVPFQLAGGEEKTVTLTYLPADPNAWRGRGTIDAVITEYGGEPAAGKPFTLSYIVPRDGYVPVLEGVLNGEGRFRLQNVRCGPEGPQFYLRIGEDWIRRIQVTEPNHQYFEFHLAPEVNDIVPDVTFLDMRANRDVSLRSLRGHVVCLEFWATWCGPCQAPMTRLNEMMRNRPPSWDGHVDVLAASIDDSPEVVQSYVKLRGWNDVRHIWAGAEGQTGFDSPAARAFGIKGIPTALLIAPDGRIVWRGHPKDVDCETRIEELCRSTDTAFDRIN